MSGSVNCRQSTSSKGQQKEDKRKSTSVQSTPATTTTTTTGSSGFKNGTNSLNDSVFDLDSSSPCAKSSESLACRFHLPSWKRCFTKKGSSSCNCDSTPQNERHSSHHAIGGEQGRSSNNDAEKAAQGTTTTTTSLCACNSDACSVNCPLGRSPFMVNNDGFTGTGNRKTSFKITSVREKTGSESEDDDSANSDGEHCVVAPWSVNGVPSSQKVTPTGGRPSRFHIVTVSGRPYKRDRWLCQDIEPIPEEGNGNGSGRSLAATATAAAAAAASVHTLANRGQVSAAAGSNTPRRKFAITKVPEAVIQSSFSTSTVMSKPLPNKASVSKNHGGQSTEGETSVVGGPKVCVSSDESSLSSSSIHGSKADSEAGKGSPPQLSGPLPVRSTSVQLTPNVVHASSTDEGPSNAGSLNGEKAQSIEIDGKIDKAMDLVKVHLLYAVRTEVKQLKEEIDRLNKELSCLKIENCILRRHVPLEVIAVLSRMVQAETERLSSEN
ncbi:hypothetical protein M514_00479 [Trichuris suis]|uniref:TSC-22/dip/bun family protein n=1 Tax=Trichuris suis TaxID=68888 RepID=A0A085NRH5_9BILA|nr:hypothetical protein M514_00479 [Trichuris suis]